MDFRKLNKVSPKYNYPLPKMDHIIQKVVGYQRISMLDGFSGYNQIMVHPMDQDKIAFTTPWGTFMYAKINFWSDECRGHISQGNGHSLC